MLAIDNFIRMSIEIIYNIDQNPIIKKRFQKEINKYNAFFGDAEQIKTYTLIGYEWSVQTGEITPTLKLKRNKITIKYKDIIDKMFA